MASDSLKQFNEWLEAAKTMADELETQKVFHTLFLYHFSIFYQFKRNLQMLLPYLSFSFYF